MIEIKFEGREEEVIRELSEKWKFSPEKVLYLALANYQFTCLRIEEGYFPQWLKDGQPHPDDIVYGCPDFDD